MTLSREEVHRRIPCLTKIDDGALRRAVVDMTADAPDYFWERPASSNHHPPVCRGENGLWVHTLMVAAAADRLADSYELRYGVERDNALAAAVLHDQRKFHDGRDSAHEAHDVVMSMEVMNAEDIPGAVASAVSAHMGPSGWGYRGPEPDTHLDELVHSADMFVSSDAGSPPVHGPLPEELQDRGLEVLPDE